MRISDWSSDVCSSDLTHAGGVGAGAARAQQGVGDGGQAERGAGAFVALVEDGNVDVQVALQRYVGGHVDQGWLEHAVAEVRGVGAGVEQARAGGPWPTGVAACARRLPRLVFRRDRKSTRLNSSH